MPDARLEAQAAGLVQVAGGVPRLEQLRRLPGADEQPNCLLSRT